jgi:murein DD-endopeptidase MepM/ murein hydrolase activator NlpD
MKRLVALAAVLALSARADAQSDSVRTWGRRYTEWFFAGDLGNLYARFAPAIHVSADSVKLAALQRRVGDALGRKQDVVQERVVGPLYEQTVTVEKIAQLVIVRFGIDTMGRITSFIVLPSPQTEAVSAFLDYHTKTDLRLPFMGTWTVLWGGRTLAQNQHASSPDERFASDFVVTRQGVTHGGDGTRNADYFCFGQQVLAPGEGTVVDEVDTVSDNVPGTTNDATPLGNYVVIDHGNGEFSFLAHLKAGSVLVRRGQHVARTDVIGSVGNSGNAIEPHLHYHLQSTPSFMVGAGMPAQFQHYTANDAPVDRGEPTRGQIVRPAS